MVHCLTRTMMTSTVMATVTTTRTTRLSKTHLLSTHSQTSERNVRRIFIKININSELELNAQHFTTYTSCWITKNWCMFTPNNVYATHLLYLGRNAPFSSKFWCRICPTTTANIGPLNVMSLLLLLSTASTNLRPLNWTERAAEWWWCWWRWWHHSSNRVAHHKKYIYYYISILLTYQWFRRVTFHIQYRMYKMIVVCGKTFAISVPMLEMHRKFSCLSLLLFLSSLLLLVHCVSFCVEIKTTITSIRASGTFHSIKFWLAKP